MEMKFKIHTWNDPAVPKSEPKCSKVLQDYVYDPKEHKLHKAGEIKIYEEIQSHYESTKLSDKLRRAALGDPFALGSPSGAYIDTTNIPTNLAEVLNQKQTAQRQFEQLPDELKQLFNGNFAEFVKCVEDGSYQQRLLDFARSKSGTDGNSNPGTDPSANPGATNN